MLKQFSILRLSLCLTLEITYFLVSLTNAYDFNGLINLKEKKLVLKTN